MRILFTIILSAILGAVVPACTRGDGDNATGTGETPSLVSIAVTPANPRIELGKTLQFNATGTYSDSSTKDLTSSSTWTTANGKTATIDTAGLAMALGGGSAVISATWGTITGSATLSIRDVLLESPFGFHPASVAKPGYPDNGYTDATNIGVTWTREGLYAFWFKVQPNISQPTYTFADYDRQWRAVPANMRILGNISPQPTNAQGYCLPNSYIPIDEQKYAAFVKATVERYDGDGIDDMPGLTNPITYWQVGNEPRSATTGFADLQRITYTAIKDACPDCTVLIGGVPGMPPADVFIDGFDKDYKPILDALAGKYVDVLDFHWYGSATGDYRGAKQVYDHIRAVLQADGFPADLPVWITEMGAYSGDPAPVIAGIDFPAQTERQQALDYFKRFVYPLSFGVKKIFPAFGLMEGFKFDGSYFDYTGLIYDGVDSGDAGLGVKKLGYYTYRKMTEMLEGSDWNSIEPVRETGDVYIYKFVKNGKEIYAAWWDYFNDGSYTPGKTIGVALSGLNGKSAVVTEVVPKFSSGAEVADYASAFNSSTVTVSGGSATLTLGDSPVVVEVSPAAVKRTFIMIHLEAGYKACKDNNLPAGLISNGTTTDDVCSKDLSWQEFFWPTVIELVEKADAYGFKLTLAFTPQWGKFIANDSARLDLVRQWKTQGHELGFQHHSLTHPDWDGYVNVYSKGTDTVNDALYLGTVSDGFSYVAALASPDDIVSSTTGSLPFDFPSLMTSPVLIYGEGNADNSYLKLGPLRSLAPIESRPFIGAIERDLTQLTIRVCSTVMNDMPVDDALPILQEQYRNMPEDEVFGIVWHEFDYFKRKDAYIQWFEFIKANGNSVKTMSKIAGEYSK